MAFLIRGVYRLGREEADLSLANQRFTFFGSLLSHKIQYALKEI